MFFVTSDLHGFPLVRFQNGLRSIGFGDNDFLYILGDVIDRHGDGGAAMLRWLTRQPNMQLLMGNHEAMMLACESVLYSRDPDPVKNLGGGLRRQLLHWSDNGGEATIRGFKTLAEEDPGCVPEILAYVRSAPLFAAARVRGRDFLLTHAGLGGFDPDKGIGEYTADELLWNRPSLDDRYFDETLTVFGHTPTILFGQAYSGRIIRTETWYDIDVNLPGQVRAAVLRLDDLKEFYL